MLFRTHKFLSLKKTAATLMMRHYPDVCSSSDWMKQIINQSGALPRSKYCCVMEFLRSFLRLHFAGGVAKCRLFSQAKIPVVKISSVS